MGARGEAMVGGQMVGAVFGSSRPTHYFFFIIFTPTNPALAVKGKFNNSMENTLPRGCEIALRSALSRATDRSQKSIMSWRSLVHCTGALTLCLPKGDGCVCASK